eukprot:436473_1
MTTDNKQDNQFNDILFEQYGKCHSLLQTHFEHQEFRPQQLEVIINTLNNNDSVVIMATGSGKSMCFYIPPLYTNKICIIVSPLKSLINDQMSHLAKRGLKATNMNYNNEQIIQQIKAKDCLYIFSCPEVFQCNAKIELLQQINDTYGICCICIDEAHCIDEWGSGFRPEYARLSFLRDKLPTVPIIAATATASLNTRSIIFKKLNLGQQNHSVRFFVASFDRTNLSYNFSKQTTIINDLCNKEYFKDGSVIIYCPRRNDCLMVADELHKKNITTCDAYHGGFSNGKMGIFNVLFQL